MWHNYDGELVSYGKIEPGETFGQNTSISHPWSIRPVSCGSKSKFAIQGEDVWAPTDGDIEEQTVHIDYKVPDLDVFDKIL